MKRPEPKPQKKAIRTGSVREKINRLLKRRERFRGYPTLVIMFVSVAFYFGVRTYLGDEKHAQLRFVEAQTERSGDLTLAAEAQPFKPVFSGEPYETSLRLRESGALLMAVSLAAFERFRVQGEFPPTASEILADLEKRSLLPPGIGIKDGAVRSALSELKVNYRADPFSFEIFSLPTSNPESPAILFRFPLPPGEANSIMYFQSSSGVVPRVPRQFSTAEQLHAAGWSIRHWRGEALPLDESAVRNLHDQHAWFRSLDNGGN